MGKATEHPAFATRQGRALLTHDKRDFIVLHQECVNSGVAHSGIIVSDQVPVGVLLRRLMRNLGHVPIIAEYGLISLGPASRSLSEDSLGATL